MISAEAVIIAAFGFAAAALVFAGIGMALALRAGKLDGDNRVFVADVDRLRGLNDEGILLLEDAEERAEALELEHTEERARTYAAIREKYGAGAVGDLVVGDIERLLSPAPGEADGDPGSGSAVPV